MSRTRKSYTYEGDMSILKRHLVEKVPVSDPCDQLGLNPTVFYGWQKPFFENGAAAFEKTRRRRVDRRHHKTETLEASLAQKNEE
jgi:transposase